MFIAACSQHPSYHEVAPISEYVEPSSTKADRVIFDWCDFWVGITNLNISQKLFSVVITKVKNDAVVYRETGGEIVGYPQIVFAPSCEIELDPGRYKLKVKAYFQNPNVHRSLNGAVEFKSGQTYLVRGDQCFWCLLKKVPKRLCGYKKKKQDKSCSVQTCYISASKASPLTLIRNLRARTAQSESPHADFRGRCRVPCVSRE